MVRRCARHPEIPATGSCPRCGRATCVQCLPAGDPRGLCLDCSLPPSAHLPGTLIALLTGLNALAFAAAASLMMYEAVTGTRVLTGAGEELPEVGAAFIGFAIVAACSAICILAIQFARLKSRTAASIASVAVMIPCLGPCCIFGIPLGIWGLTTLKKIPDDAWGRS